MKSDMTPGKAGEFFPSGAIAFFAVMLAGFGIIWLAMYFLLIHRQVGL